MFRRLRVRPVGWLVAVATLAAMGATLVVAAPGGATQGPLKVKEVNFEAACILAPGVLNETGTIKVHQVGEAPETVGEGESFNVVNNKITTTTPVNWGETLFASGSRSAKGAVTSTIVDVANATPASKNIAKPPEFPSGLPFTTVVENAAVSFTVPSENRSFSSGPYTATGAAGSVATGTVDTAAGFREISAGHYEGTGAGIVSETTGFNAAGETNIGPFTVNCTAPAGVVVSESRITAPTTTTSTTTETPPTTTTESTTTTTETTTTTSTKKLKCGEPPEASIFFNGAQSEGTLNINNRATATGVGGPIKCGVLSLNSVNEAFPFKIPASGITYEPFKLKLFFLPLETMLFVDGPAEGLLTAHEYINAKGEEAVGLNTSFTAPVTSTISFFGFACSLGPFPVEETTGKSGTLEGHFLEGEILVGEKGKLVGNTFAVPAIQRSRTCPGIVAWVLNFVMGLPAAPGASTVTSTETFVPELEPGDPLPKPL